MMTTHTDKTRERKKNPDTQKNNTDVTDEMISETVALLLFVPRDTQQLSNDKCIKRYTSKLKLAITGICIIT